MGAEFNNNTLQHMCAANHRRFDRSAIRGFWAVTLQNPRLICFATRHPKKAGRMVLGFSYVLGTVHLLWTWVRQVGIVVELPLWLRSPEGLHNQLVQHSRDSPGRPFSLSLPARHARLFNDNIAISKRRLRSLHAGLPSATESEKDVSGSSRGGIGYQTQLALLFAVRLGMIVSAWYGNVGATLLMSLVQVVVAPYSLFAAFSLFVALSPAMYAPHTVAFVGLPWLAGGASSLISPMLGPEAVATAVAFHNERLCFAVTGWMVVAFLVVDQVLCVYCHWWTPTVEFTAKKTAKHIIWGFLNCKTFYLVLLVHLWRAETRFSLAVWLVDAVLGITPRVANWIARTSCHWSGLFYAAHRMGHLPRVYDHAHKLHHFMPGTTAFDAHVYGNGMPEELVGLVVELVGALWFGVMPASFNRSVLHLSWTNKVGHTQQPQDVHGNNHHTDHHLRHLRNFGIFNALMDMYFGTNTNNDRYPVISHNVPFPGLLAAESDVEVKNRGGAEFLVFDVAKTATDQDVTFTFTQRQ